MKKRMRVLALCTLTLAIVACDRPKPPEPTPTPPQPQTEAPAPAAENTPAAMARTPSPAGVKLTITSPSNGATISSPATVTFALEGMTVAPAGSTEPNSGHHHLLVDTGLPPLDQPIPTDANHVHFGKGQTEAQVELAPGTHTLQLLLGDANHVPHDPPVASDQITVTVQ